MVGTALLGVPVALLIAGCSHCNAPVVRTVEAPRHREPAPRPQPAPAVTTVAELLPPNAKSGECYVKVFVPEKFETFQETVCVREASERLEMVPAQYEWVEEKILVKDASTVLEEVPAEFAWEERNIQTDPGHTGWHVDKTARCVADNQAAEEMYCLKTQEPVFKTVRAQKLVKPASTRETVIPAEYQAVRRQKLITPATTRRIPIPAEYATVDKVKKVADSRVEWQRVTCMQESKTEASSPSDAKLAKSTQP
jgi:hypothetical protein